MIQKDIIQRLIHQISIVLARMIGKEPKEQLMILEEYFEQQNGLSSKGMDGVSNENLLNYLSKEMNLNVYQIEAVAGALNARGDVFLKEQKTEQASKDFERAILLLDYVDTETSTFSFDRNDLIASIADKLKQVI